ncbi:MAG: hypothetical protein HYZ92_05925, partial [Candidatus Omnitrophica bacterium]|nr:hypothetical protein [Candidatus Omnitrophota bacterium]
MKEHASRQALESGSSPRVPGWLLTGFLGLEALYLCMAQLGDLRRHATLFLIEFGLGFLLYLGIVWRVRRLPPGQSVRRGVVWAVLAAGLVFRLTLVGLRPTLSDDVYRYLWDGRVQQAGIDPYRYAPDDEALRGLRDDAWSLINHREIPTIYPPLMQLAFRVGAALSPTILTQKIIFLLCDVAIMAVLAWWLPCVGVSSLMSLVYAWHPLVVVEVAGSGHNDPLGVLWLVIGLALWSARRPVAATTALAVAFLSKLFTALLWPFYALRHRRFLPVFLAAVVLAALWCRGSPHLGQGLGYSSRAWEFNSSLYRLMLPLLGTPLLTRSVCAGILLVVGIMAARRTDDLVQYTCWILQAAMLVTPVLEPWYLLWLIPLLCLRFSWAWLSFSGLVMFSYTVLVDYVSDGIWRIPSWTFWIEYLPLYA